MPVFLNRQAFDDRLPVGHVGAVGQGEVRDEGGSVAAVLRRLDRRVRLVHGAVAGGVLGRSAAAPARPDRPSAQATPAPTTTSTPAAAASTAYRPGTSRPPGRLACFASVAARGRDRAGGRSRVNGRCGRGFGADLGPGRADDAVGQLPAFAVVGGIGAAGAHELRRRPPARQPVALRRLVQRRVRDRPGPSRPSSGTTACRPTRAAPTGRRRSPRSPVRVRPVYCPPRPLLARARP